MRIEGKRVLADRRRWFYRQSLDRVARSVRGLGPRLVHYNSRGDWGHLETIGPAVAQRIDVVAGDVRDRSAVCEAIRGCDIVFHLAALIGIPYSYQAVESYVDTNIRGTLNVLAACRDARVARLVHTSTSEVYGTARYTPIDERHPLGAQSPYAATKVAADQLALSYHASFGTPAIVVRPFNTFGPRQSMRAVIPTIISQALEGDEIHLGSIDTVRDFLFVEDTARGFLAAAESDVGVGDVFNLGTGRGETIGRVVELVGEQMGRTFRVVEQAERRRPRESEVLRLECSAQKAAEQLDWRPRYSLEEGIARTIQWLRARRQGERAVQYAI